MAPSTARRAIGFVFAVVFGVVLIEIVLRIAPLFAPEPARSFISEAGRIRMSNVRAYPGEPAIRLPPDQKADILVVGDSFPFGPYEAYEDIYPSRLATQLHANVVNLSSQSQLPPSYNRMVEVGARYRPRMVVYAVFANDFRYPNDVRPRRLALNRAYETLPGDERLFFTSYDTRGAFLNAARAVTNHFVSYAAFKMFQQQRAVSASQPLSWRQGGGNFFVFPDRSYWDSMMAWDREPVRRATEHNHELIKEARRFSTEALRATFVVVMQPSKEMVYGPMTGALRPRVYSEEWDRTYAELITRLRGSGIPVIDLTGDLRRRAHAGAKLYHSIDGHFNQEGHRVVAAILSRALSPLLVR